MPPTSYRAAAEVGVLPRDEQGGLSEATRAGPPYRRVAEVGVNPWGATRGVEQEGLGGGAGGPSLSACGGGGGPPAGRCAGRR